MIIDIFDLHRRLSFSFQEALAQLGTPDCPLLLERPKDPTHGDVSTPVAMALAKRLKKPPLEVARELLSRFKPEEGLVASVEAVPPGFINLRLKPEVLQGILAHALAQGASYGRNDRLADKDILLEFVSANPTGPLNVVNARAAVLGDAITQLVRACGGKVATEYYINDAGNQAKLFGESLEAALSRVKGVPKEAPEGGYQGSYMEDLAREYQAEEGRTPLPVDPLQASTMLGEWGMDRIIQWQKSSLERYGVVFDGWFSERRSLHDTGSVHGALEKLAGMGLTYAKDGAVWIKTSEHGSPKDEVLLKSNGTPAYFAADIAYHLHKLARGHRAIVNIMGPDHHGHILRMKAAHRALGHPEADLEFLVAQHVSLLSGGEKVKMSKREGKFVTMEELLTDVGRDAARYFFVMRGANTHLDFDLEVARKKTDENPVYYVQYAHARICSLLHKCAERGILPAVEAADFSPLTEPEAFLLLKEVMEFPQWVVESGKSYEPHRIVAFLQGLAAGFHHFYSKHRILDAEPSIARARLGLASGVRAVIRNALALLGVSAPEQM